ncbi:MAG: 5-formyltetrahydrofolate cyclo-ligase [Chloroflexota bacterium]|nr:5-formyltetrahydrofolate cyclo-ligase [Chloroflexota bacterium]
MRKKFGDEFRRQASQAICARLAPWDIFRTSDVILTYMPLGTEVDLRPLLADFPEKRWLLPRILAGENGRMVFHAYDPHNLILHSFGMAEPAPHLQQVSPAEIQLVLVPGLAFDRSGWWLGYGGGYFDRFLMDFSGVSAGVVFQILLLYALPYGKYDILMQWLVTEDTLIKGIEKAEMVI